MILVVDDDPQVRALLCEQLKTAGYSVDGLASGNEAVNRVLKGGIELVIMDVNMEGADGLMVLESFRSYPPTQRVPVIMITGLPVPHVRLKALQLGANYFLAKPFQFKTLLEKIESLIGKRKVS